MDGTEDDLLLEDKSDNEKEEDQMTQTNLQERNFQRKFPKIPLIGIKRIQKINGTVHGVIL